MVSKLLTVLAIALGFSSGAHALRNGDGLRRIRPTLASAESKALALRGGAVETETLINGLATLNILQGSAGWLAPKTIMDSYGVKDMSAEETAYLRFLMGINVVAGVTMIADEASAASACLLAWGVSTAANVPLLETLGAKKGAVITTVALFCGLGELARQGKISSDIVGNILALLLIPVSAFEIVSPKTITEQYGIGEQSALGASLMENFSFSKIATGAFLLVGKLTGKRGLGLAAACGINAVNCIKTMTRSDKIGIKKGGLIFWTALSVAIGGLAYMNEME